MKQAQALDDHLDGGGAPLGSLHGVPVALKVRGQGNMLPFLLFETLDIYFSIPPGFLQRERSPYYLGIRYEQRQCSTS